MGSRTHAANLAVLLTLAVAAGGCADAGDTGDAGPLPVDQCLNPSDLDIIDGLSVGLDGGIPDGGVPDGGPYPLSYMAALRIEVETCADEMCIGAILIDNGADECMSACLDTTEAAGLSQGCVGCQNEIMRCAAAACINVCLGDSTELCDLCGLENCGARMVECTGLPQNLPQ